MVDVLDYSASWPPPAAVRAGGYVGVVRYIGTPGRGKNLTAAEARAMLSAGIPVGLVYEEGAGWMRGGSAAGVQAARRALADAKDCGVGVRCVYFAADFDVIAAGEMAAIEQCLDGAAGVLGRARVGVYGEADVIDACLSAGHATWGWQTRAWSRGRVSTRAHLLQQIGAVHPGGVECDRSTVLRPDWGQWPAPDGTTTNLEDDVSAEDVWKQSIPVPANAKQLFARPAYTAAELLMGPNIRGAQLAQTVTAQGKQITELTGTVTGLTQLLAAQQPGLTAEQITDAVAAAVIRVRVEVDTDQPDPAIADEEPAGAPATGGQA